MTVRYVGPGGNNSNDGLSWANRKLTLNGVEDSPVAAGDKVYVGPGTYRELLTIDVSGGNTYSTGTISVTNGSAVVTGSGTTFSGNVAADYILHILKLASGTDGVTTSATATSHPFTSAAGNFQAGHVGQTIRINTIGAYIIIARVSATEVTVAKPDNSSFTMTAGTGLTYNVGPEAPYDILSVDSNTQITLTKPWAGPSFTGLAYLTYNPIRYIGDYTGANTDGVGGVVRITGSDNDTTATRASCITSTTKNYRLFQGFLFDTTTSTILDIKTNSTNWILDKCVIRGSATFKGLIFTGTGIGHCVRDTLFWENGNGSSLEFVHSSTHTSDSIVQSTIFLVLQSSILFTRVGGVLLRNLFVKGSRGTAISVSTALTTGESVTLNNSIVTENSTGVGGTVAGEITENYNVFFGNNANRSNTLTGANSLTHPPFFDVRWFFQLVTEGAGPNHATQLITPFDLAGASPLLNVAGINPSGSDMRGTAVQGSQREWGALEYDSTLKIEGGGGGPGIFGGMVR